MTITRLLRTAGVGIAISGVSVDFAVAQSASADSLALARVAEHIDDARFDSARVALTRWQSEYEATARESERGAAAMLAARLERDGVVAQHAWLTLALAHPFSSDAGLALLRVGQAAVLQGDTATALVYLTRLVDDFPESGQRAEAQLWIARAQSLAGRAGAACEAARAGMATGSSAEVVGLLRIQEQRACAAAPVQPTVAAAPAPGGRFAVQSGAFRGRAGADALIARLRDAELDPRLVRVPANDLMRVRVGGFATQAEAIALRDRLRAAGLDAVVVGDGDQETPVP